MKILAFDTSSTALSVALLEDEKLVAESTVTVKKNHSISLMPTIDFLVAQAGWQPSDLERIVVAQGPGSYTGLRVAVATAKTLAYALDIDLVGVSSLQALTDLSVDGVVIPFMDARRNNVYVGFYENGQALVPDCHASFVDVLEQAKTFEKVTFVGEVANFVDQIKESLPEATILSSLPSAQLIGRLGLSLTSVDVDAFVPHYLK
ncbi:MAG: tRNA (adenosine(37)-N6)-threonylcarbamoyltransferase complex dimerization subunit type 1 TsaB, partial [Streptococcus salivarius]|nr:tRNA (adenosine(37)-N6)-threonylcarbamoyltransferase complex dimerization subunit type 1 TsaB [Streptococcus salivarius]